ncbi:MAG: hypothetical protein N2203_00940 [Bacteroidia bacterium]|nr:hypothetical protein [Bacteroidia bacterium]
MIVFLFWVVTLLVVVYKINLYVNKQFVFFVLIAKSIFIFLISYTSLSEISFLNTPDEDNYFNDILLFHQYAKEYPSLYFQFLFDIEPANDDIFNQYFTYTNAWYKAPEFFYNDNRWVIKIHSLLSFISGGHLSVHRLMSAFFSLVGWALVFQFIKNIIFFNSAKDKVSDRFMSSVFLISSFFPSFFFFTSFVLKESLMVLFMGLIVTVLYQWIIEKQWNFVNILTGIFLIIISFLFRVSYLLPFMLFSFWYLIVYGYIQKLRVIIFIGGLFFLFVLVTITIRYGFNKNLASIIQYRQERFLDASKGGIFLVSTKKFVRVPYEWNYLYIDSTDNVPSFRIKYNVPIMYWYLTHLQDTIQELNKDTTEKYKGLYYIEKANKTIFISPINFQKPLFYNLKSIVESLAVFFFYPHHIQSVMDLIVWFENIAILLLLIATVLYARVHPLHFVYVFMLVLYFILMISVSSPNIGAITRYRYFLLPFLFINIATQFHLRKVNPLQ